MQSKLYKTKTMNNLINNDIIITGIQRWDLGIGSNCRDIALELSKSNRVLYVNQPVDYYSSIFRKSDHSVVQRKEIIAGRKNDIIRYNDRLWIFNPGTRIFPISSLKNNTIFDFLNKINNKRLAGDIRNAAGKLGFSNYIIISDSDMFRSFYLKELLKPSKYIYYTRDNLLAVDFWKTQGLRIEPLHMAKADSVVSNSLHLAKLASAYNNNTRFVGQGCDTEAFRINYDQNLPEEFREIGTPVVGYIGSLKSLRLDIGIIEHIASSRKNWNIVLVGPEDEDFKHSSLHSMPNVHFLGSRDEKVLPKYLKAFDVAINPQVVNEVTIGNYPRKIDEYLAMGKPVVATRTEAMEYFKEYVSLPATRDEWLQAIEFELANANDSTRIIRRIKFASEHTWASSVKEILNSIKIN